MWGGIYLFKELYKKNTLSQICEIVLNIHAYVKYQLSKSRSYYTLSSVQSGKKYLDKSYYMCSHTRSWNITKKIVVDMCRRIRVPIGIRY